MFADQKRTFCSVFPDFRRLSVCLRAQSPETEIRTLLPKDGIPSIDAPKYASVKDADAFMGPDEMVIGINIKGDKRAYSVPLLSSHEIVNDVVGGSAVSVTW